MKISLVIITKNEERHLDETISSCVDLVDEIIVVDSGSTDSTAQIALKHNARLHYNEFLGFGLQKNFAVSLASNEWVLCLDADEKLSSELRKNIKKELDNPQFDAYVLTRRNKFLGKYLKHGAGYPDNSIRLFNVNKARWSNDLVHEHVIVDGKTGCLQGDYLHDSAESLGKYLDKQNQYTSIQADMMIAKNKRFSLAKLLISPTWHFIKYFFIKLGFLDGVPGLVHTLIGSWNSFAKYAKLYERIYNNKNNKG